SHARIKSPSGSAGSGVNSMKSNHSTISVSVPSSSSSTTTTSSSATIGGGQSDNIDLIISRLQNELTRSQETYADLGFLKHSLGELEKTILVNEHKDHQDNKDIDNDNDSNNNNNDDDDNSNNNKKKKKKKKDLMDVNGQSSGSGNNNNNSYNAALFNYEKLLEQKDQEYTAEIERLIKGFEDTKTNMLNQHERELATLRQELMTSQQTQEISKQALLMAASNLELIVTGVSTMKEENKQLLETVQKEKEELTSALSTLETKHKQEISHLVLETDAEREGLLKKHTHELAEAAAAAAAAARMAVDTSDNNRTEEEVDSQAAAVTTTSPSSSSPSPPSPPSPPPLSSSPSTSSELESLKEELCALRQAEEAHSQKIEALTKENIDLLQLLEDTKKELIKVQQETTKQSENNLEPLEESTLPMTNKNNNNNNDSTTTTFNITNQVDLQSRNTTTTSLLPPPPPIPPSPPLLSTVATAITDVASIMVHTSEENDDSKPEFSWSRFVFPRAKRHPADLSQPSTMLLSGGFMFIGLCVYALWHKMEEAITREAGLL
ncbi:hypothetical protein BGZ65_009367, partial [Modicella reniformis]